MRRAVKINKRAIEELKEEIEKAKLEAGEAIGDVEKCGSTIEEQIDKVGVEISELTR